MRHPELEVIERRCNAFAADVLMPRAPFLSYLGDDDPVEAVATLARRFRVSRDAAAIRLRELGRLTQEQVDGIRAKNARLLSEQKQKEKEAEGGPTYHRTHPRNLGPRYVSTVLDALDSDAITLVDAAHYLDSKVTTIDRMSAELHGRAHIDG